MPRSTRSMPRAWMPWDAASDRFRPVPPRRAWSGASRRAGRHGTRSGRILPSMHGRIFGSTSPRARWRSGPLHPDGALDRASQSPRPSVAGPDPRAPAQHPGDACLTGLACMPDLGPITPCVSIRYRLVLRVECRRPRAAPMVPLRVVGPQPKRGEDDAARMTRRDRVAGAPAVRPRLGHDPAHRSGGLDSAGQRVGRTVAGLAGRPVGHEESPSSPTQGSG